MHKGIIRLLLLLLLLLPLYHQAGLWCTCLRATLRWLLPCTRPLACISPGRQKNNMLLPLLVCTGGTVVHMSSGYAALVAALYLGPAMKSSQHDDMFEVKEPANVPYVVLGTALLFFGWFGVSGERCVTCDIH
jgi:hypothetical protein